MEMTTLAAALAIAALITWLVMRSRGNGARRAKGNARSRTADVVNTVLGWPPEPSRVLTVAERRAYSLLIEAVHDHMVLAQVPLARFIKVPTRHSYHEWMRRVGQLCADLVVCDAQSQVITVIEVRRPAGQDPERTRKRHERMDRVLKKAGIRVVVWHEDALPHVNVVRDVVLGASAGLSSDEGAAKIRTRPTETGKPSPAQVAHVPVLARSISMRLDEDDENGAQREPAPSTWFDELDTSPAPLHSPSTPMAKHRS
jgi:hypothetical protein